MKRSNDQGLFCGIPEPPILASCPSDYKNAGALCAKPTPVDDNRPANCFTIHNGNITNVGNGLCMEISNNKLQNGSNIQLSKCNKETTQNFYWDNHDNQIKLFNNKNKCLMINGGIKEGSPIYLWDTVKKIDMELLQLFTYDEYQKIFRVIGKEYVLVISAKQVNPTTYILILEKYDPNNKLQKWNFSKDTDNSFTNNGANCALGARSKKSDLGMGIYEAVECPNGTTNTGGSCLGSFGRGAGRDDVFYDGWKKCAQEDGGGDRNNCEKNGARVYPKCSYLAKQKGYDNPDNWTNDGCCMCSPSIRDISKVGKCPPQRGYNDAEKAKLKNYTKKNGGLCYIDCEKTYGKGYYNNGTSCWKDPVVESGFEKMKCLADEFKTGARCYKHCSDGGVNSGAKLCMIGPDKMICPSGWFKAEVPPPFPGGLCFKETPPRFSNIGLISSMPKRRKIPYSTTKN